MAESLNSRQFPWWAHLTGGRPMRDMGHAFTDVVAGRDVRYWRDRLGRDWMAYGAWSTFRVARFSK